MNPLYPDYSRCILNTVASVGRYYGAGSGYPSLPALDDILQKGYRNVVLMVFDGMGMDALARHLPDSGFLMRHVAQTLTSVYPSTTTAAMTAYYSGLSPNEHAWLGWSLFFKEYGRWIDTFTNQDSFTKQPLSGIDAARAVMPYETMYEKIHNATKGAVVCHTILPEHIVFPEQPNRHHRTSDVKELFGKTVRLCEEPGKKFIFTYWPEPDMSMHMLGCEAEAVRERIAEINAFSEAMREQLEDTVVMISADHGLIDITEEVWLNEIPELDECLVMPPCVETRALSLFVKADMRAVFEERFLRLLPDFILMPRTAVFKSGLLGLGSRHRKVEDFIGDYLACAVGTRMLRYAAHTTMKKQPYKGQHAGLTAKEMLVPLIVFECPPRS